MLHGNLLLRGWRLSDVSFYTTELPQYMLIELARGLTPDVVHVAGAITFTLLVLLAAMLAKGRTRGREAAVRMGIAAGIMLAPQLGSGVYLLMLDPDHVGTAVPVLLVWLLLDRAPRRWYVPVAATGLLAWALVADSMVLIIGVLPLLAVCVTRCYQRIVRERLSPRCWWFELSLAAGSLISAVLAKTALAQIARHGGFRVWPVGSQLASYGELPSHFMLTGQGLLLLFGADLFGRDLGLPAALAMLHLVGLALAAWAVCIAVRDPGGGSPQHQGDRGGAAVLRGAGRPAAGPAPGCGQDGAGPADRGNRLPGVPGPRDGGASAASPGPAAHQQAVERRPPDPHPRQLGD